VLDNGETVFPEITPRNWHQASALCSSLGANFGMCQQSCRGKGCAYDYRPVWTNEKCDTPSWDPEYPDGYPDGGDDETPTADRWPTGQPVWPIVELNHDSATSERLDHLWQDFSDGQWYAWELPSAPSDRFLGMGKWVPLRSNHPDVVAEQARVTNIRIEQMIIGEFSGGVPRLADPSSNAGTQYCSALGAVTGPAGTAWAAAATVEQNMPMYTSPYNEKFENTPNYLLGRKSVTAGSWQTHTNGWEWTIQVTSPGSLFIWFQTDAFHGNLPDELLRHGWARMDSTGFKRVRSGTSISKDLSVYFKPYAPVGELKFTGGLGEQASGNYEAWNLLFAGVVYGCQYDASADSTSGGGGGSGTNGGGNGGGGDGGIDSGGAPALPPVLQHEGRYIYHSAVVDDLGNDLSKAVQACQALSPRGKPVGNYKSGRTDRGVTCGGDIHMFDSWYDVRQFYYVAGAGTVAVGNYQEGAGPDGKCGHSGNQFVGMSAVPPRGTEGWSSNANGQRVLCTSLDPPDNGGGGGDTGGGGGDTGGGGGDTSTCSAVGSVVGPPPKVWLAPNTLEEGGEMYATPYKQYFDNVPAVLIGKQSVTSDGFAGLVSAPWTWTIPITSPGTVYIWYQYDNFNGGTAFQDALESDGWQMINTEASGGPGKPFSRRFTRGGRTKSLALRLYAKEVTTDLTFNGMTSVGRFASWNLFIGGVIFGC